MRTIILFGAGLVMTIAAPICAADNTLTESDSAVELLMSQLSSDDPDTQSQAVSRAVKLGHVASPAAAMLAAVACNHPKQRTRQRALGAIRAFGAQGRAATPILLQALSDLEDSDRQLACFVLGYAAFGSIEAARNLSAIAADANEDSRTRISAVASLTQIHVFDANVISSLKVAATDSDQRISLRAVQALGAAGKADASVSETITNCLRRNVDSSDQQLTIAIGAVTTAQVPCQTALPVLISLAKRKLGRRFTDFTVVVAIEAIGQYGAAATEAVPVLLDALESTDQLIRVVAAHSLYLITGNAEQVLPVFAQSLAKLDRMPNAAALRAIADIGSEANYLGSKIRELKFTGAHRRLAAETLIDIGDSAPYDTQPGPAPYQKSAIPVQLIQTATPATWWFIRFASITSLSLDDVEAETAIPLLSVPLETENRLTRRLLVQLIATSDHRSAARVTVLEGAQQDPDPRVRQLATLALKSDSR